MQGVIQSHQSLRGFAQHGVRFQSLDAGSDQAAGDCPLCGKEGHFYVNVTTQLWDCKACGASGNFQGFLARKAAVNREHPDAGDRLAALAKDRGVTVKTLRAVGVGWDGNGYTVEAKAIAKNGGFKTNDLRRYQIGAHTMATAGGKNGLVMPMEWRGSERVWVCEGEWDLMAWVEILNANGVQDDACAVTGACNFPRDMAPLFVGKDVVFLFDNDEPGQRGMLRSWSLLDGVAKSRKRLQWPEGLPKGFDVRDLYKAESRKPRTTLRKVEELLHADLPSVLPTSGGGVAVPAAVRHDLEQPTGKGISHKEVEKVFTKWLKLDSLEPLDVVFGTALANRTSMDPLWLFLVGRSGACKSELLMSLRKAPLVYCTTSLTPHALISGANFGGGDPSLIPRIIGKTLVVKDFTTILDAAQMIRDDIFGTLRDAYDGRTQREFGTIVRSYEGKFGILAGVTPKIYGVTHQNSVLGERFVRYRIRIKGQVNAGREAIMRALDNALDTEKMRDEFADVAQKALDRKVDREHCPTAPRWLKERLVDLAQWIGTMRAAVDRERYTQVVTFKPEGELATRLAKQLLSLGIGIGLYRGKRELDEEVYRTIASVAVDTAPDREMKIVKALYIHRHDEYAKTQEVTEWTGFPIATARYALDDMALLGIVKRSDASVGGWRISERMVDKMDDLKMFQGEKAWKTLRKAHRQKSPKKKPARGAPQSRGSAPRSSTGNEGGRGQSGTPVVRRWNTSARNDGAPTLMS